MNRGSLVFLCFSGVFLLSGCATTKGGSAPLLESRVQALENRLQVLEADAASSRAGAPAAGIVEGRAAGGATVETMTKKDIQAALKNAGYYDGAVDGKIGPKTKAALMDFQKDAGLKVDGIAGRNTKEKLFKYLP